MLKVLLGSVAIATGVVAQATTWNVSLTDPDNSGLTGVDSLTNALTKAGSGDSIVIAPGVYDLSRLTPVAVSSYGYAYLCAFDGKGGVRQANLKLRGANTRHWSEKTPEEDTVLRGAAGASIFYAHGGVGRQSSYYHLTFENGRRVAHADTGSYGGGAISMVQTEQISLKNETCIATNCVFRSCSSEYSGGATLGPDVYDSLYTNCTSDAGGGATKAFCGNNGGKIYNTNTYVRCVFVDCSAAEAGAISGEALETLTDCTFVRCTARSDRVGGAVCAISRMTRLSGCTFDSCSSSRGGAVYFGAGADLIENCTFTNNSALADYGGGLFGDKPIGTIANSTFCGNSATNAGGGFYLGMNSTVGLVTNCVFSGNAADYYGAAFACSAAIGSLVDCTFADNAAPSAGGALYTAGIGALSGCAFTGNRAMPGSGSGGAIFNTGNLASVSNCTFAGNAAGWAGGAVYSTTIGSVSGSTIADNIAVANSGGVYLKTASGTFTDCTFHSNSNDVTKFGAHVNQALGLIRCSVSGFGDIAAKQYDGCVFTNCVYQYTQPDWGADAHGLVTCPYALGDVTMRNCLMRDCLASRLIASEGVRTDVANCTFVDNVLDDAHPETNKGHAIMFFAFRKNSEPQVASTNVMVNCIFADNHVRNNPNVRVDPCDAQFQGSASGVLGHTAVSNCIYKTQYVGNSGGTFESDALTRADPKFVAGNPRHPDAPYLMIRRSSAARGTGLVQPWMADGTDLIGTPMVSGGKVDMGCYQCNLKPTGGVIVVR